MPSLHDLQAGFANHVFGRNRPGFLETIAPGHFPAERQIQIYRNNVFISLTEALHAIYPVVARLVGEGFFHYAADAFIHAYPPHQGNLHDFGGDFAEFLAGFTPAASLVYLPDVARLEWSYHQVFHAAEAAPLAMDALQAVPEEDCGGLRFNLHPATRLLASEYPVLTIWEANQASYTGDDTVDLSAGGEKLMIVRRQMEMQFERLSEGDYSLLAAFAAGQPFSQACTAALSAEPEYDLTQTLPRHLLQGTLVRYY